MSMKKIVQRNLSLTDRYKLESIMRGNLVDDGGTICDNCNAIIANIATIRNQHGKRFHVGLDCMKTLVQSLHNISDYEQELYEFNANVRFLKWCEIAEVIEEEQYGFRVHYRNKNGRLVTQIAFRGSLERQGFPLPKPKG